MDLTTQLDTVVELLGRLGAEVRAEHLGGEGGGACALHGRRIVFLDLDADVATRLERALGALASCPEFDSVYVPPVIRELIERVVR